MVAWLARFLLLHCMGLADGLRAELSRYAFRCGDCATMQPTNSWSVTVMECSTSGVAVCLRCARRLTLDIIQKRKSNGDLAISEFNRPRSVLRSDEESLRDFKARWGCQ